MSMDHSLGVSRIKGRVFYLAPPLPSEPDLPRGPRWPRDTARVGTPRTVSGMCEDSPSVSTCMPMQQRAVEGHSDLASSGPQSPLG